MANSKIFDIARKYKSLGLVNSTDFLLQPALAVELLHDLTEIGVRVVGCDSWRYLDREKKDPTRILELVGGGTGAEFPFEISIDENARIIEEFLVNKLPEDVDLISLIVDDPQIPVPFSYLIRDIDEA